MANLDLSALIAALSRPEAYPHPVDRVEVLQTHISVVFLAGQFVYKIKKPVDLGFLDFSTLEKRKHFCEEEVRLNRRLASQVYLGVVPIFSVPEASAKIGPLTARPTPSAGRGEGGIEWAVRMNRLPNEATLESRLKRGEVTAEQIRALAERVADFHRHAEASERIASFARFAVVADNARENFTQMEPLVGTTVSPVVFERLCALTETHLARLRNLIETRASTGVPRDTHGDLHLDHVYLFPAETPPGDLVIIDCIEFSDRFRFADPVADMAFLAMDLAFHGRRDLARIFADAFFGASGDAEGRRLLPFYSAYRAIVRAKIEGMELSEREIDASERTDAAHRARAHWLLALGELEQPARRPLLVLVVGLPGSGKSTLSKAFAARANVEVLRSDVVRKELAAGHVEENIYKDEWTEHTYTELLTRAEKLFWQGQRVLIDANFREDRWRRMFLDAAKRWAIPVLFVHCRAEPDVVQKRLAARRNDASDADWCVYQSLQSSWELLSEEVRNATLEVDTSGELVKSESCVLAQLSREDLA